MNAITYELERLRESNVALANALEVAVKTIERLTMGSALHADTVLALAKAALKNNKG